MASGRLPTESLVAEAMGNSLDTVDPDAFDNCEDASIKLGITVESANRNYSDCGSLVPEEKDPISWDQFTHLYNPDVAALLEKLKSKKGPDFSLRDCQEIALHAIGSGKQYEYCTPENLRGSSIIA
jgi:hypothetical protein